MKSNRFWALALSAALIFLTSTACGVPNPFQFLFERQQPAPALTAVPPDLIPGATVAPALTDLQAGLQNLDSYRAVLQMETRLTSGGEAQETITIVQERIRSQKKFHSGTTSAGNPLTAATVEYFELGGDLFLLTGQGSQQPECSLLTSGAEANSTLAESSRALSPDQVFGPIRTDQLIAAGEPLNGVLTDHYTVDQQSMGLPAGQGQQGEIWISQEGGFVVRYQGQAQGVISGFGDAGQQQGVSSWTYELQSINSLADIPLAPACVLAQQVTNSIPIAPDAANKSQVGDVITYESGQKPPALADFYRQELAAGGWSVQERLQLESLVILNAARSGTSIEITLSAQDPGSMVMIQQK